jgi:preprotein translocase subunit YajC
VAQALQSADARAFRQFPARTGGPACLSSLVDPLEFFVFISQAIAQTAPAAAPAGDFASSLSGMLPILLMFAVLYFVMIRPQMKRQKEHRAMIDALAKGDEVVSGGGLLGKVTKLGDTYVSIEVAPNTEVQIQRSAVVQVLPKGTMQ